MEHSVVSFSVTAVTPNPGYNVTTVFDSFLRYKVSIEH